MASTREPRLVLRFALASLAAFVLVGVASVMLVIRDARDRAELTGADHAIFVGRSVLAPALVGVDLSEPLSGPAYEDVDRVVRERVLTDGNAVRVKIWRLDGTILYSDEPELVGVRFPEEAHEMEEVAGGAIELGISDLDEEENVYERDLADKLFYTYAPISLEPGGPVVAVAEIYQDYRFIQQDIDAAVRRIAGILVLGLLVLFALLFPIALGASRELRKRNDRLNELLELEQLTVAELRDLSRKKDDFVSAASHELRTPLTAIAGVLGTLKQPGVGDDPAMRAELLDSADRQAKRLDRLIADLLSAAHLDGSGPVTTERLDLSTLLSSVVGALENRDRIRLDAPDAYVVTDGGRVARALAHLIDNALKYSPPDTLVDVGASVDRDGFRIWVTDQGDGIEPDQFEPIFDRFHQVDQSATRSHGGLGLGLHLAKVHVQELGGEIEVASAPGRGSTFTIVVPNVPTPERPRDGSPASVAAS